MNFQELDLCILRVLITNKKYALEFIHECSEKVFSPELWRFAKLIIDYIRVYKNAPTRRILLERNSGPNNNASVSYIESVYDKLDNIKYNENEYPHDLEKLKNRFAEQMLVKLKDNLSNEGGQINVKKGLQEINATLQHIKSINQIKAYEQNTLKGSIQDFRNRYMEKLKNPDFGVGLMTGFSALDYVLGGIRSSELFLVGGSTGSGKSMMLINMAINMWAGENIKFLENTDIIETTKTEFKEGCDVLYFSLEMPFDSCQERILSRLSMIPHKLIRDARLNTEQEGKLAKSIKFIERHQNELEIVDVPRGATIETIELVFNEICIRAKKPKVVVIDYLTLMDYESEKEAEDWLKNAKIAEQLHEFGRVHDVVMISAVQLNDTKLGAGENQIGLHRIGRSKLIAHNCDMFVQIEKRPNEENFADCSLHLIKSRRSELMKFKVHRDFSCCALLDISYANDVDQDDISRDVADIIQGK